MRFFIHAEHPFVLGDIHGINAGIDTVEPYPDEKSVGSACIGCVEEVGVGIFSCAYHLSPESAGDNIARVRAVDVVGLDGVLPLCPPVSESEILPLMDGEGIVGIELDIIVFLGEPGSGKALPARDGGRGEEDLIGIVGHL